jgi:hypothetical protein
MADRLRRSLSTTINRHWHTHFEVVRRNTTVTNELLAYATMNESSALFMLPKIERFDIRVEMQSRHSRDTLNKFELLCIK